MRSRIAAALLALVTGLGAAGAQAAEEPSYAERHETMQACEMRGDAAACIWAADYFIEFQPQLGGSIVQYYFRACHLGSAEGCREGGKVHAEGLYGQSPDWTKANAQYGKGCELGDEASCQAKAALPAPDEFLAAHNAKAQAAHAAAVAEQQAEQARQLSANLAGLDSACRSAGGTPAQCIQAGDAYWQGGDGYGADQARAADYYLLACEKSTRGDDCERAYIRLWLNRDRESQTLLADISRIAPAVDKRCLTGPRDYDACIDYGWLLEGNYGWPQDLDLAYGRYSFACGHDKGMACYNRAVMLRKGLGRDPDYKAAANEYFLACRLGYGKACGWATEMLWTENDDYPGLEKDFPRMVEAQFLWCTRGGGDNNTCTYSADKYFNAQDGVEKDKGRAARAYLIACRDGNATACFNAGAAHTWDTQHAPASEAIALKLFDHSCAQGNQGGCDEAAHKREAGLTGLGRTIDPILPEDERFVLAQFDVYEGDKLRGLETIQWMAAGGEPNAQLLLGRIYMQGWADIVQKSDYHAARLMDAAAEQGHAEAALAYAIAVKNDSYFGVNRMPGGQFDLTFDRALDRAIDLGSEEAIEWRAAIDANQAAYLEQRHREAVAQHQANLASAAAAQRAQIQRAWDQFDPEKRGYGPDNRVCALILQGGRMTQECMSQDHFDEYYDPQR